MMRDEQLDLFPPTAFEITRKGHTIYFTYHGAHAISVQDDDPIRLKYEMVRLILAGVATMEQVAALFHLSSSTISVYYHNLERGGLDGLRDHRLDRPSKAQRAQAIRDLYEAYLRNPSLSPRKLQGLMSNPERLSFYTVKATVLLFRKGKTPAELIK